MVNIPNTEYITVNANGIFVGGKPATTDRGEEINLPDSVHRDFAHIQTLNKNVAELHVLSSETRGERAKPGNPSGKHGPNTWCRVKFENGNFGAWVFYNEYASAAFCACYCAVDCAYDVRNNALFRSVVLGETIDKSKAKQNVLTNALKDTNLSQCVDMTDIPNTAYITIKFCWCYYYVNHDDRFWGIGTFVGGHYVVKYHGQTMYEYHGEARDTYTHLFNNSEYKFSDIYPRIARGSITEVHVGAFETRGEYAKPGNPDGVFGPNAWCRVKYKNGDLGPWVFVNDCGSAANCAGRCVFLCASSIRESASFRAALCGPIAKSNANLAMTQNALTNALKDTDLSKFIGAHTIGSYEIIVRNKQNTRG